MTLPWRRDFIPHKRRGAEVLIESVRGDVSLLTAEQVAAIRHLYYLDDPRTTAELVIAGAIQP